MKVPMPKGLAVIQTAIKVFKYLYDDQTKTYGLETPVTLTVRGVGVGIGNYCSPDGVFQIQVINADTIHFEIKPFLAKTRYWNGPDIIPNNKFRSMLASLFHDFAWYFADEIAAATGKTATEVRSWGTGVMYTVWMWASKHSTAGQIEAHLAFHVINTCEPWYVKVKGLFKRRAVVLVALLSLAVAGCVPPPDWEVIEISGTNAVNNQVEK